MGRHTFYMAIQLTMKVEDVRGLNGRISQGDESVSEDASLSNGGDLSSYRV